MQAPSPTPGPRLRAPSWSASSGRGTPTGRERLPSHHPPDPPQPPPEHHHHPQQRQRQRQYRVVCAALSLVAVLGLYACYDERAAPAPLRAFMSKRGFGAASRRERVAAAAAKAEQLRRARAAAEEAAAAAGPAERTLVLYNVHHDETPLDNLHRENLEFFLEVAVNSEEERPLVDYVFLVPPLPEHPAPRRRIPPAQASGGKGRKGRRGGKGLSIRRRWPRAAEGDESEEEEEVPLPYPLPVFPDLPNVRVVERPHKCLGASGLAELLREQEGDAEGGGQEQEEDGEGGVSQSQEEEGAEQRQAQARERVGEEEAALGKEKGKGTWRVDLEAYAHFVLLDSSVRGPFLPRYLHRGRRGSLEQAAAADPWATPQTRRPWTSVLTDRLGGPRDVGLVGPTVSCEQELHVQAPVWATDRAGLRLLLAAGVLDCVQADGTDAGRGAAGEEGEEGNGQGGAPRAFWEGYEAAATRAVVRAGRGLDCLMLRYQGVDLARLQESGVACTGGDNPSLPFRNDGLPVNPLEVVFVVARPHLLASDPLLRRYTEYALGRVPLAANEYETPRVQAAVAARKARLARAVKECGAELDAAHLLARCPECAPPPGQELLDKFLRDHYAQGYDYRFTLPERGFVGSWARPAPPPQCEAFAQFNAPDLSA